MTEILVGEGTNSQRRDGDISFCVVDGTPPKTEKERVDLCQQSEEFIDSLEKRIINPFTQIALTWEGEIYSVDVGKKSHSLFIEKNLKDIYLTPKEAVLGFRKHLRSEKNIKESGRRVPGILTLGNDQKYYIRVDMARDNFNLMNQLQDVKIVKTLKHSKAQAFWNAVGPIMAQYGDTLQYVNTDSFKGINADLSERDIGLYLTANYNIHKLKTHHINPVRKKQRKTSSTSSGKHPSKTRKDGYVEDASVTNRYTPDYRGARFALAAILNYRPVKDSSIQYRTRKGHSYVKIDDLFNVIDKKIGQKKMSQKTEREFLYDSGVRAILFKLPSASTK